MIDIEKRGVGTVFVGRRVMVGVVLFGGVFGVVAFAVGFVELIDTFAKDADVVVDFFVGGSGGVVVRLVELLEESKVPVLLLGHLGLVSRRHVQPRVAQHLPSAGPALRVPVEHGHQEVGERLCLGLLEAVLFDQHVLQRPVVQALDVAQVTR